MKIISKSDNFCVLETPGLSLYKHHSGDDIPPSTLSFIKDVDNCENFYSGNETPHRGFGHICFNIKGSLDDFCNDLETHGVNFIKKPSDGRMRSIAFIKDPTGYWIEVLSRDVKDSVFNSKTPYSSEIQGLLDSNIPNLSQTMLRVSNIQETLNFYCNILTMFKVNFKEFNDFSLTFLSSEYINDEICEQTDAISTIVKRLWLPVVELTYNYDMGDEVYTTSSIEDVVMFRGLVFVATRNIREDEVLKIFNGQITDNIVAPCLLEKKKQMRLEDPDGYPIYIVF